MLKSHLQVYKDMQSVKKASREFKEFIVEKHGIDLSKPPDLTGGERHVMSCNEDAKAYLTFQQNRFFNRETATEKAKKEAKDCINSVIKTVTM